jgi:hypothetical protein
LPVGLTSRHELFGSGFDLVGGSRFLQSLFWSGPAFLQFITWSDLSFWLAFRFPDARYRFPPRGVAV